MTTKLTAKEKRGVAVDRLLAAMDRCALARGEAQWTNGYRAAPSSLKEADRLYAKEQTQWRIVEREEKAFRRLAQRIVREASR